MSWRRPPSIAPRGLKRTGGGQPASAACPSQPAAPPPSRGAGGASSRLAALSTPRSRGGETPRASVRASASGSTVKTTVTKKSSVPGVGSKTVTVEKEKTVPEPRYNREKVMHPEDVYRSQKREPPSKPAKPCPKVVQGKFYSKDEVRLWEDWQKYRDYVEEIKCWRQGRQFLTQKQKDDIAFAKWHQKQEEQDEMKWKAGKLKVKPPHLKPPPITPRKRPPIKVPTPDRRELSPTEEGKKRYEKRDECGNYIRYNSIHKPHPDDLYKASNSNPPEYVSPPLTSDGKFKKPSETTEEEKFALRRYRRWEEYYYQVQAWENDEEYVGDPFIHELVKDLGPPPGVKQKVAARRLSGIAPRGRSPAPRTPGKAPTRTPGAARKSTGSAWMDRGLATLRGLSGAANEDYCPPQRTPFRGGSPPPPGGAQPRPTAVRSKSAERPSTRARPPTRPSAAPCPPEAAAPSAVREPPRRAFLRRGAGVRNVALSKPTSKSQQVVPLVRTKEPPKSFREVRNAAMQPPCPAVPQMQMASPQMQLPFADADISINDIRDEAEVERRRQAFLNQRQAEQQQREARMRRYMVPEDVPIRRFGRCPLTPRPPSPPGRSRRNLLIDYGEAPSPPSRSPEYGVSVRDQERWMNEPFENRRRQQIPTYLRNPYEYRVDCARRLRETQRQIAEFSEPLDLSLPEVVPFGPLQSPPTPEVELTPPPFREPPCAELIDLGTPSPPPRARTPSPPRRPPSPLPPMEPLPQIDFQARLASIRQIQQGIDQDRAQLAMPPQRRGQEIDSLVHRVERARDNNPPRDEYERVMQEVERFERNIRLHPSRPPRQRVPQVPILPDLAYPPLGEQACLLLEQMDPNFSPSRL